MEKVTSMAKLAKVDVMEKENLLHVKEVDIGFAAKKLITDLQKKKKVSERQTFEYQNECQVFLQYCQVIGKVPFAVSSCEEHCVLRSKIYGSTSRPSYG